MVQTTHWQYIIIFHIGSILPKELFMLTFLEQMSSSPGFSWVRAITKCYMRFNRVVRILHTSLWKDSLNSDCQEFLQYQQNEQLPLIFIQWTKKTYGIEGNPGSDLGQCVYFFLQIPYFLSKVMFFFFIVLCLHVQLNL